MNDLPQPAVDMDLTTKPKTQLPLSIWIYMTISAAIFVAGVAASALKLVRDTSGYFEENCRIWSNNCVADPISKVVVLTLIVVGGIGFLAASLLALTWTPNND